VRTREEKTARRFDTPGATPRESGAEGGSQGNALLNRELGTPAQTIETTAKPSPYANMSAEELRAKLRALPMPQNPQEGENGMDKGVGGG
jgi:hypothetical protein